MIKINLADLHPNLRKKLGSEEILYVFNTRELVRLCRDFSEDRFGILDNGSSDFIYMHDKLEEMT